MTQKTSNMASGDVSFLNGGNISYMEHLYAQYRRDEKSLDPGWRAFFESMGGQGADAGGPSWARSDWPLTNGSPDGEADAVALREKIAARAPGLGQEAVRSDTLDSVRAHYDDTRPIVFRGHLAADLDPLRLTKGHPASGTSAGELRFYGNGYGPSDFH